MPVRIGIRHLNKYNFSEVYPSGNLRFILSKKLNENGHFLSKNEFLDFQEISGLFKGTYGAGKNAGLSSLMKKRKKNWFFDVLK